MSCVSVLSQCLGWLCLVGWIRPQCCLKSSVCVRLQDSTCWAVCWEAEGGRIFQIQPRGETAQEQTSPTLSCCSVSHSVLPLDRCQQSCRTDTSMHCEQGKIFRTSLEALVVIIRFIEFPIVFSACWCSVCYKQGQSDPKLTVSQRVSFDLAQVMSLDSFIPGFAREE